MLQDSAAWRCNSMVHSSRRLPSLGTEHTVAAPSTSWLCAASPLHVPLPGMSAPQADQSPLLPQGLGVAQADIKKLRDAGMHTVEGVLIKSRREFNEIKGIRCRQIWTAGFATVSAAVSIPQAR